MKYFLLILLLASCSSVKKKRDITISDKEYDVFSKETFLRSEFKDNDKSVKSALENCFSGKIKTGLREIKKNFKTQGKTSSYWNQVGSCYLYNNYLKKAMFYYKIGLSYNKNDANILNNYAYIHMKRKQYSKAYEILNKFPGKNTSNVANYNLASLHFYFGKYEKSINVLSNLHKLSPRDPDINLLMAKNYIYLRNNQKANYHFNQINEKYLENSEIASFKSFNLLKLGKLEEAKDVLESSDSSKSTGSLGKSLSDLIDQKMVKRQDKEGKRDV